MRCVATRHTRSSSPSSALEPQAVQIKSLGIRSAFLPLRRSLATRVGDFHAAPMLLLDLETKLGARASFAAFAFHPLNLTLAPPILQHLVDGLDDRDLTAADLPGQYDAGLASLTQLGHQGVALFALSIFDILLHDAVAREGEQPVYALLGGSDASLQAYNSNGLGLAPEAGLTREARDLVSEGGFSHVKLRLGREDSAADLAAIHEVRDAIGPDVRLSVDYNQSLPTSDAVTTCRALDEQGLEWIEEPVVYDDLAVNAILTQELRTPIQIGENFWGPRAGAEALAKAACDYVMPDLLRIGGFTGWQRFAAIAARHDIPVSSHLSPEASLHAMAATPNAHWVEYVDWISDFVEAPLVPKQGHLRPSDRPGLGIAWNEKALAPYLVT